MGWCVYWNILLTSLLAYEDPSLTNVFAVITTNSGECKQNTLPFDLVCVKCRSLSEKPLCQHHALNAIPGLKDTDLVMLVDNDIVFSDWSKEKIVETYNSKYKGKVVVSSQSWDYPTMTRWRPPKKLQTLKIPQYVNTGFVMSTAKLLKGVLNMIENADKEWLGYMGKLGISRALYMDHEVGLKSDQGVFGLFLFASYDKPFVMDMDQDFVYTVTNVLNFYTPSGFSDFLHSYIPWFEKCESMFYALPDYCHGELPKSRFKSHKRDVIVDGKTVVYRHCQHRDVRLCDDLFEVNNCTITKRANVSNGLTVTGPLDSFGFHFNSKPLKRTFDVIANQMEHCLIYKEHISDNSYEKSIPKVSDLFLERTSRYID